MLPIALLYVCLFLGIYKLLCKSKKIIESKTKLLLGVFFAILVLTQIIVYYFAAGYPTVDFEKVFTGAYNYAITGEILDPYLDYFYKFPNNMPITIILQFIFRFFNRLGVTNFFIVGAVFNGICIELTYLFVFLLVKELAGKTNAFMAIIIMYFCMPLQTYISVFYTDTTTMMYPVAAIYFAVLLMKQKSEQKNDKIKYTILIILLGLFVAVGTIIKNSVALALIAVLIVLVLNMQFKKAIACLASFALFFVIISSMFSAFMYENILDESIAEDMSTPFIAWIAMGLQGDGAHSADDNHYIWSFETAEEKTNAANELLLERMEEHGFVGYLEFLNKKAVRSFGSGNFNAQNIVANTLMKENFAVDILFPEGEYFVIYDTIAQGFHVFIMLCLVMGAFFSMRKKFYKFLMPQVATFGLLLFLLIWEAGTRYLLNYYPIMIISGAVCVLHFISAKPKQSALIDNNHV